MPTTSIHGTPDYAELDALGLDPSEVIYFSSNINPYGPPPSVVEAVQEEISRSFLARYPDSRSQRLREKIGAFHGLPPDAVLVGNGTADLIWLLAHAYGNNRNAAILSPTFSEYADGVIMAGGHPVYFPLPRLAAYLRPLRLAPQGSARPADSATVSRRRARQLSRRARRSKAPRPGSSSSATPTTRPANI